MPDTTVHITVPDVGDTVRHHDRHHVVHGWLRYAPPHAMTCRCGERWHGLRNAQRQPNCFDCGTVMTCTDCPRDGTHLNGKTGSRHCDAHTDLPRPLLFATRTNATHLRLRSADTGDTIARVTHVTPTGDRPEFAPNTIRAAHRTAETLDGQPTGHYDTIPDTEEKP